MTMRTVLLHGGTIVDGTGRAPFPADLRIEGDRIASIGQSGRGRVSAGCIADLVVFDPETVGSPATYLRPEQPPRGIHYVLSAGRLTVRAGKIVAPQSVS